MINMKNTLKQRKKFLEEELVRYEDYLIATDPGTEEYQQIYENYLKVLEELYPKKNLWNKILDVAKILVPAGVSVGLGIFAYHKNENLESKDGDVWKEARRR